MSYLVLARKWRPKTFAEVVGQQHVTSTLMKAFEKGRLAHAYLFSGPRGCGKTSSARLLAKIINCEDPQGGEPCNKCSSCLAVSSGTHLDMIEIDGASNRGIDEIRDLREKIGYASAQSDSKIYIIDEVHMLTQQAFNALLKTLEEPPGHVYLVFATTEPHKVPATILSRCQRFNFKRLELAELIGQLVRICDEENIEYDSEALTLICRRADGSMRDAESLLDQCISASDGKIALKTVREVLGLVDSQIIYSLLDSVGRRDREGALAVVDSVVSSGMDLEEFFIAFLEGIRNLLVISVSAGRTGWLDLTAGEIEELTTIAGKFKVEDLLFLFRSMSRAFRELKTSSQPRYHIEAAVAEAASWESVVEIGELIDRLESGPSGKARTGTERKNDGAGGPGRTDSTPDVGVDGEVAGTVAGLKKSHSGVEVCETAPPTIDTPEKENTFLAALGGKDEWERFLAQVRESKLTLGIWLMTADVAGIEGNKLILSFTSQNRFAMEMIRETRNRRLIESHLEKFYGRKFTVEACETVNLQQGSGRSDLQAEMEIVARTRPGVGERAYGGEGAGESAGDDSSVGSRREIGDIPGDRPIKEAGDVAGRRSGRKTGKGAGSGTGNVESRGPSRDDAAAEVENPTLQRIMKEFDAELFD